jgi:DNA-binding SARP family transcriptional activator
MLRRVEIRVLGPAQVWRESALVDLGTRKQRALLAALALHGGRPVSVDTIVDLLWGDDAPPAVGATLQAYVSGLRKALEPSRQRRAPAALLVTVAPGYALRLQPEQLDAARFARAVSNQHSRLGAVSSLVPSGRARLRAEDLQEAVGDLDAALALWRGEPYGELEDAPDARAERTRLEELRLLALEDRALATIWLGDDATAAAELEALTSAHPLRERLWGVRALALVRCGRQADALDVLSQVRTVLDDELGLEPGPELRALQTAVLRQDPALEWRPAGEPEEPAAVGGSRTTAAAPERKDGTPAASTRSAPAWPMVGRDRQLQILDQLLDESAQAGPCFATLVGEPGIGKTRLATELIGLAEEREVSVLVGRCSQDDGAPPLWPWASVLQDLGRTLPSTEGEQDGLTQFGAWEEIVAAVTEAAREQPTLLVLDDLHWADTATLRVLRRLAETPASCRLLVLLTWRAHPEPTGALADLVEMLGRRHATRLALEGLSSSEAADVVEAVAHAVPTSAEASALRERTDGNPFFLVEYARLAAERGDLSALLSQHDRPAAVHDVLVRRLDRLPEATRTVLTLAGVVGRSFDLATLAGASGREEDDLLDELEPAQAAGLVREDGIDRFTFAHALVRDTVYSGLSASRRARAHARVAEALDGTPGRETEVAHHWIAAGPAHVPRAWRAAVAAAGQARSVHAHEQSAELLSTALSAMAEDGTAGPLDRYEVLMQLIDAYRWTAMWPEMVRYVEAAIAVAEEIGDVELLAQAAGSTTIGALWQSAPYGEVHAGIVAALRHCLERLPTSDSPTRCRVMLSLANELYYGATFAERLALVEEALAMAERLVDDRLLLDANQIAFAALWCRATTERRLGFAVRGMELARRLGLEQAYVVSATLRAVVEGELGRVSDMWSSVQVARAEAERLRIPYGLIVLESLALPWLAMAGRFEECEELLVRIEELDRQMSLEQSGDATAGALVALRVWQGRGAEVMPMLLAMEDSMMSMSPVVTSHLLRTGQRDEAARHHAEHPVTLPEDDWFAMLSWCTAAEVACGVEDQVLAGTAYARLAPYAGQSASAGSSNAFGPVDAFLALAARAVGETALARRHADRAEELMVEWEIPLAGQWFRDQREQFGF